MNRSMWVLLAALFVGVAAAPAPASAQFQAGVVIDRDGIRHFHLAIGHYYGYPVQTVTRWHPSWLHPDELPVVYLLARQARVSPDVVIALRQQGWSWLDITYHLRVDPAIYVTYLPAYGPPYGVAHGYWRKPPRSHLRRLTDRQIIDYVNVVFWASVHHRPVTEVIVIRERAPSWTHFARVEAPRIRYQEPPRAAPPPVQSAPRPAQPRPAAQAPAPAARSATAPPPAAGRGAPATTVPQAGARAPAPAAAQAPAAGRGPATAAPPAANRAPTPAPAANRAPAPAANRTPTPAPAANRAPAPAANRTPTPAPAANRAPAPAANRTPTPAPAANRAPAPAANRAPAPAANRTPPAASRPPAAANNGRGNGRGG